MGLDQGFLTLLTSTVTVEQWQGEDQWGNTVYSADFPAKAFVGSVANSFGRDASQGREERIEAATELIMDAINIKVRDRITLPGGTVLYVTAVTTNLDETGAALYQSVTASNNERG